MSNNKLQELTEQLYSEGLSKGRIEGEKVLADARAEADKIISEARSQAEKIAASSPASEDTLFCVPSAKVINTLSALSTRMALPVSL